MRNMDRGDWGIVLSELGVPSRCEIRLEPDMNEKVAMLKNRWAVEPPLEEVSIMITKGESVYMGRYPEGVVFRLNDKEEQVAFLTNDQARELGEKLIGKKA